MSTTRDFISRLLGWNKVELPMVNEKSISTENQLPTRNNTVFPLTPDIPIPRGRRSEPQNFTYDELGNFLTYLGELPAPWYFPIIPVIRRLAQSNADIGQALENVVTLGNAGHQIFFDPGVKPELVDKMRAHILNIQKNWASGTAGADGLLSKLISQVMISGALSAEWVPKPDLSGIEACILVNPENIVAKLDRRKTSYEFYQKTGKSGKELVKLNSLTYQYYALNGDGESPYGCPPYLTALRNIKTQTSMLDNIDYVINQLGVMGFLEVLIELPDQLANESTSVYEARLNSKLDEAKARVLDGLKTGAVVGFKDSHEIDFHGVSKDFNGVSTIFDQNEKMIASGIKTDGAMLGRSSNNSETGITILFTKLISQLKLVQGIVGKFWEYGITMELRMAGFKFDFVKVKFDYSTIQDDLKFQQSREIKIRNLLALYQDGIISLEQYADEMGYEKPDQAKPRIDRNAPAATDQAGAVKKKKREDGKNASDRKVRDKNKPQGTIKK